MENKRFCKIEQEISKVLRDMVLRAMENSLLGEIKATMDERMLTWENIPELKPENHSPLQNT
eukprot:8808461-Ditylum_brightwellii.AAC.1